MTSQTDKQEEPLSPSRKETSFNAALNDIVEEVAILTKMSKRHQRDLDKLKPMTL
jgi:hypothetical protein